MKIKYSYKVLIQANGDDLIVIEKDGQQIYLSIDNDLPTLYERAVKLRNDIICNKNKFLIALNDKKESLRKLLV